MTSIFCLRLNDCLLAQGGRQAGLSGGRLSANQINTRPASISGTDSSMPMVRPPHRKPSCASGSRNSSQNAARDAVAERERAEDQARPLQRAGADQQRQHDQQHAAPSSAAS